MSKRPATRAQHRQHHPHVPPLNVKPAAPLLLYKTAHTRLGHARHQHPAGEHREIPMTSGGDSQDFHAAANILTRTRNLNDADALSKRYLEPLRDADNTPRSASS